MKNESIHRLRHIQESRWFRISYFFSIIFVIMAGCVLLFFGLMLPPKGEIHYSVLIAFGQILTWTGTGFGIDYHYRYKYYPPLFSAETPSRPKSSKKNATETVSDITAE